MIRGFMLACAGMLLAACGGGGGGGGGGAAPIGGGVGGGTNPPPAAQSDFDQGIFRDPALYKDLCLAPRGPGFPDLQGATEDENDWLRAWSHDLYLWYDEITDADPALYATLDYFDLMQTFALTPSGAPRDQFHFTYDTQVWEQLSGAGVAAGYGLEFELVSATPPRRIVVAYIEPGYPAEAAGLSRGDVIVAVDGVDAVNVNSAAQVDILNAGLFPRSAGENHDFAVEDFDGGNLRNVSLTSQQVTSDPVPLATIASTSSGPVGYLLFHAHIATAEARLVQEMQTFEAAGITELILDVRYNGGGFLDIANMLAFMVAGPSAASGQVFDETQFNDKHTVRNPVTGALLAPDTFHTTTQGFSLPPGDPLPSVNLNRLFVLSGPGTCSASEAVINGLRGIGIDVVLIGDTTCGKPYGFYPTDNCGTTYFSIQSRGVNAVGFGDYADGFVPATSPAQPFEVSGCAVGDDFRNPLGDPMEARLTTALEYIAAGDCSGAPVVMGSQAAAASKSVRLANPGQALRDPLRIPGTVRTR